MSRAASSLDVNHKKNDDSGSSSLSLEESPASFHSIIEPCDDLDEYPTSESCTMPNNFSLPLAWEDTITKFSKGDVSFTNNSFSSTWIKALSPTLIQTEQRRMQTSPSVPTPSCTDYKKMTFEREKNDDDKLINKLSLNENAQQHYQKSDDLLKFTEEDLVLLNSSPHHLDQTSNNTFTDQTPHTINTVKQSIHNITPPAESYPRNVFRNKTKKQTSLPNNFMLEKKQDTESIHTANQFCAALSFFHPELNFPPPKQTEKNEAFDSVAKMIQGEARPIANVPEHQLEAPEKTTIYVIYEDTYTPVSWYSNDMSNKDIREMILCACDSMIDSGFILREIVEIPEECKDVEECAYKTTVHGKKVYYKLKKRFEFEEFHLLKNGGVYTLQKSTEREDLKKITGDRWRKFKVKIEPLLHIEALKAIDIMKRGTNLLKHTEMGFPHLRQFQLSSDCQRLLWYSSPDSLQSTILHIKSIKEIQLGQQSPLFQAYKLPTLENLSFSIYYESETGLQKTMSSLLPKMHSLNRFSLDLTCKSEAEYDNWVCGLKALVYHTNKLLLSKEELLNHSQRFITAVKNNCPGFVLESSIFSNNEDAKRESLEDCLDLSIHSLPDLSKKLKRLQKNLTKTEKRIYRFQEEYNYHGELTQTGSDNNDIPVDLAVFSESNNDDTLRNIGETSVFKTLTEAEDDRLEYKRMLELRISVTELINEANNMILNTTATLTTSDDEEGACSQTNILPRPEILKKINQVLWKAEVDIENIDDMLSRLRERRDTTNLNLKESLSKFKLQFKIDSSIQKIKDNVMSTLFTLINSPTSSTKV